MIRHKSFATVMLLLFLFLSMLFAIMRFPIINEWFKGFFDLTQDRGIIKIYNVFALIINAAFLVFGIIDVYRQWQEHEKPYNYKIICFSFSLMIIELALRVCYGSFPQGASAHGYINAMFICLCFFYYLFAALLLAGVAAGTSFIR
jgi:hypothetical protein